MKGLRLHHGMTAVRNGREGSIDKQMARTIST